MFGCAVSVVFWQFKWESRTKRGKHEAKMYVEWEWKGTNSGRYIDRHAHTRTHQQIHRMFMWTNPLSIFYSSAIRLYKSTHQWHGKKMFIRIARKWKKKLFTKFSFKTFSLFFGRSASFNRNRFSLYFLFFTLSGFVSFPHKSCSKRKYHNWKRTEKIMGGFAFLHSNKRNCEWKSCKNLNKIVC